MLNKFFALMASFTMCVGITLNNPIILANAEESDCVPSEVYSIANSYSMGDVLNVRSLYDDNENEIAYCAEFINGYAIYDINNQIIEFSDSNKSPYDGLISKSYYAGPLNYYIEDDDEYLNVVSDEIVSDASFTKQIKIFEEQSLDMATDIKISTQSNEETKYYDVVLPGQTRKLDYNTKGTCGSLAATIMLCYYNDYVDSNFIYPYLSNNPQTLHNYLVNYIELLNEDGTRHGSTLESFIGGLRAAWSSMSRNSLYITGEKVSSDMWGRAYYYVQVLNRPLCLMINNHPQYKCHWVVVYGASQLRQGSLVKGRYFIINDGWGRDGIRLIEGFNIGMVYMTKD